jgi:hypothetical protein
VELGQVGGDAIKIYEYRAAGLPVLTTPIIGTRERPMAGVFVCDAAEHVKWLADAGRGRTRIERMEMHIEPDLTWRAKTESIAQMMGVRRD